MALLNPIYACVVPLLLVTTIPLAVFAGITTTFAFSILIFRVFVVYLDIALSLVSQSLAHLTESGRGKTRHLRPPRPSSASSSVHSRNNSVSPSASSALLKRHRRIRRPSSSVYSAGSATPASDMGLGLIPSVGVERDFEGVGGWRLGDGDDDDDEAWPAISSRSELDRNHRRTLSGGPANAPAEGGVLMMKGRTRSRDKRPMATPSPNSSKVRAPSAAPRLGLAGASQNEGYLPMAMSSKATKRTQ
ncbi:hypothetical protein Trco_004140 [Trichoderma cornu-damae]|uniref:Uncharacterized protein n=1 Tax=Trichoderma cornu-damae TaxID=654480 RepID=A0A9P8QSQ2_9HYPO|nr:hypothetical protein Trco_004140 [Trichoderma cornu-damae]